MLLYSCISCTFERKPNGKFYEFVSIQDTTCLNDIQKARLDVNSGKLVHCIYFGMIKKHIRYEKELEKLLSYYNISVKDKIIGCVIRNSQSRNCYCNYMKDRIEFKYGSDFIDSLEVKADIMFLINHRNDTLENYNCDRQPFYPNESTLNDSEHSTVMQKEIDAKLTYPKAYRTKQSNHEKSEVYIRFVVAKNGNASIRSFDFDFLSKRDTIYTEHFENQMKKIIRTTNWKPAQIRNTNVNAYMTYKYILK